MTTVLPSGIVVPKTYIPGLGYSPGSGPPVGGQWVAASPKLYSSTFFGDNIKALFPENQFPQFKSCFGKRRRRKSKKSLKKLKKTKKTKKSRRKSRRKSKRVSKKC